MKLTDDEVVALAVRDGQAWATPLPTVALDEPDDVAASARRGERSLYARGLLGVGDDPLGVLDAELVRNLAPARQRRVVVSMFTADGELAWYPSGPNVVYYRTDGGTGLLAETVSEAGVHSFAIVDVATCLGSCRELVAAAHAGGVRLTEDAQPTESLCLARPSGDGVDVLQVHRGVARLHASDGKEQQVELSVALDWVAALL